jgi:uncharacterized protein YndB with AHSA1/START domain
MAPDVVVRRTYPHPVGEVWAALTESPRLARWYGTYTGTGRPGGTVEVTITAEADAGGEVGEPTPVLVRECAAPHRLVLEFHGDWHVTLELAAGEGTEVSLSQRALPSVDAKDLEAGWAWYLDRLGASLRGAAMPEWSAYAP